MDYLIDSTPYFWDVVKQLIVAFFVLCTAEAVERIGKYRSREGDTTLHVLVRNVRLWRNSVLLYIVGNSIASISGGMGGTILSYAGGFILIFTFFRTIDRELSLGEIPQGAVRTAEATLYLAFCISLARDLLYPSL
jgi:hypothetical protein